MSWPFRRDHENVDISRRNNFLKMDIEPMSAGQIFARFEPLTNIRLVHLARYLIGSEDHNDISFSGSLGDIFDGEARILCFRPRSAPLLEPNAHIHAAVSQVQRMGMALTPIANDSDFFVPQ